MGPGGWDLGLGDDRQYALITPSQGPTQETYDQRPQLRLGNTREKYLKMFNNRAGYLASLNVK